MKEYITGSRVANAVKMLFNQKKDLSVLVVEGITDKKFFDKFIDNSKCTIEIAQGKDNVIDAIKILNKQNKVGVLGVVDADYHRLNNDQRLNEKNILITDTHDIETMIMRTRAFFGILAEYASKDSIKSLEKKYQKPLRELLLEYSNLIGLLRLHSLKNNLQLNFSEIDFYKFINIKTFEFSKKDFINEVVIKTNNTKVSKEQIESDFEKLQIEEYNSWDLSCGHDLSEILKIGILKVFGNQKSKQLKYLNIEEALRLSYQYEFFYITDLYKGIINWESNNKPNKIILNVEEFYFVS